MGSISSEEALISRDFPPDQVSHNQGKLIINSKLTHVGP